MVHLESAFLESERRFPSYFSLPTLTSTTRKLAISGAPKTNSVAHGRCATEFSPLNYFSMAHGLGAPQNSHIFVVHPNHVRHRILKKIKKCKEYKKNQKNLKLVPLARSRRDANLEI